MKIKILLCFLLAFVFSFSLFSQENTNQESKKISLVAKILRNSSTDQMHKVWPGYNLRTKPVFVTFSNGHIYAFNIRLQGPEWQRFNLEGMEVFYTPKDKWGITAAPMQFDFKIFGQEAFVFCLDMMLEPSFMPYFILVHERFHVYQIERFLSEKESVENDYPESDNVDNLALMQLEELVLLDFMNAFNNESYQEATTHLKTFISINQHRRAILSPISVNWEARQQMVEGLADYAAAKNLDVFGYFGPKIGQRHIAHIIERYTKDNDITERALKWRHYGVGASIAYALDFLQVKGWKKEVEQNVSLQVLLERNLKVSNQEANILVEQAYARYNFVQLKQEIKKKVEAYQQMLSYHQENFKKLPGILVNVQSPPDSGLSAGGHSKGVYSLADGSMFSYLDTSKTSSADKRWMLELISMPYLFQTNDGFRRFKVEQEGLELTVDGKPCSLSNLRERPFQQLTLKTKSCSFKSSHNPGRVSVKNGELNIIFMS